MRVIGRLCVCVCGCRLCVCVCGSRWKCWRGTFHPGVVVCIACVVKCVLQCVLQCETGVCGCWWRSWQDTFHLCVVQCDAVCDEVRIAVCVAVYVAV